MPHHLSRHPLPLPHLPHLGGAEVVQAGHSPLPHHPSIGVGGGAGQKNIEIAGGATQSSGATSTKSLVSRRSGSPRDHHQTARAEPHLEQPVHLGLVGLVGDIQPQRLRYGVSDPVLAWTFSRHFAGRMTAATLSKSRRSRRREGPATAIASPLRRCRREGGVSPKTCSARCRGPRFPAGTSPTYPLAARGWPCRCRCESRADGYRPRPPTLLLGHSVDDAHHPAASVLALAPRDNSVVTSASKPSILRVWSTR